MDGFIMVRVRIKRCPNASNLKGQEREGGVLCRKIMSSFHSMKDAESSLHDTVSQRSNSISSPQRLSKQEKNKLAQRYHVQQQKNYLEHLEAQVQELTMLLPAEARGKLPAASPSPWDGTRSPMSPAMAASGSSPTREGSTKRHGNTKTVGEAATLEDLPLHERRMVQNRISQRTSRLRKKMRIADLERQVQHLHETVNQLRRLPQSQVQAKSESGIMDGTKDAQNLLSQPSSRSMNGDSPPQLPPLKSILPHFFYPMSLPGANRTRALTM
ncbi:hypothetical protein BJ741DRAFT_79797 [Chytriomyces cf. hyalinus JEL632]|nr:hypothetical protein BJ741DRAFT_79797 [Chytriomyces cf. hyalinus JEL632]